MDPLDLSRRMRLSKQIKATVSLKALKRDQASVVEKNQADFGYKATSSSAEELLSALGHGLTWYQVKERFWILFHKGLEDNELGTFLCGVRNHISVHEFSDFLAVLAAQTSRVQNSLTPLQFESIVSLLEKLKKTDTIKALTERGPSTSSKPHTKLLSKPQILQEKVVSKLESGVPSSAKKSLAETFDQLHLKRSDLQIDYPLILSSQRLNEATANLAEWEQIFLLPASTKLQKYWKCVSCLFLYRKKCDERLLWKAKEYYLESQPLPFSGYQSWKLLLSSLQNWTLTRDQANLVILLDLQLMIIDQAHEMTPQQIQTYLDLSVNDCLKSIETLINAAEFEEQPDLLLRLELKRLQLRPVTNDELSRLQSIAISTGDETLAAKTATVLKSRGALNPGAHNMWLVSEENKLHYNMQVLSSDVIRNCLSRFDKKTRDLCFFFFRYGEDFLKLTQKPGEILSYDSLVHSARPLNDHLSYLPMQIVNCDQNAWTDLLVDLIRCSRVADWNWNLSEAFKRIGDKKNKFNSQYSAEKFDPALASLLVELSPAEVQLWQKVFQNMEDFDAQEFKEVFLLFLSKIAISVYPAHFQALNSIKEMNFSLKLIRQIEAWVICS